MTQPPEGYANAPQQPYPPQQSQQAWQYGASAQQSAPNYPPKQYRSYPRPPEYGAPNSYPMSYPQAGPGGYPVPSQAGYPVPYQQVQPKSPGGALVASLFIPGLGTILNGETGKGVGLLVGFVASFVMGFLILPVFAGLGLWIWGMVDAYQGAQRWNAAHGIIS